MWTLDENGGAAKLITAGLSEPTGLCWQDGVLYIADTGSHRILAYKDGRLSTVAGAALLAMRPSRVASSTGPPTRRSLPAPRA
ncbi:MAG: hypothetical protein ACLTSG_06690 [Lachnospiraceae bacterium]